MAGWMGLAGPKMTTMPRSLAIGLLILTALLPVAPLLLIAVVCAVSGYVVAATGVRHSERSFAAERRLRLLAVHKFRGPPAIASL